MSILHTFDTSYLKDEHKVLIYSVYRNHNLKVTISVNCIHHLHANEPFFLLFATLNYIYVRKLFGNGLQTTYL